MKKRKMGRPKGKKNQKRAKRGSYKSSKEEHSFYLNGFKDGLKFMLEMDK